MLLTSRTLLKKEDIQTFILSKDEAIGTRFTSELKCKKNKQKKRQTDRQKHIKLFSRRHKGKRKTMTSDRPETNETGLMIPKLTDVRELPDHGE